MLRQLCWPIVALIVVIAGCKKEVHEAQNGNAHEDKVVYVKTSDPKMNAASEQARSSVDTFIAALQSPRAGQSKFSVKMPVTDSKGTEHMWLDSVTLDGKVFHGIINNDAEIVTSVKIGDRVSIDRSGISDWMFLENGKLVGGFTIRVLRDAMTPTERAAFDKEIPFRIE